jgi:predicted NBD/HSP70 family sugar kinase
MKKFSFATTPSCTPVLDPDYRPIALANRAYLRAVEASKNSLFVSIAIQREGGLVSVYNTKIFADENKYQSDNLIYIERLIKSLLWLKGGWKISLFAPTYVFDFIKAAYTPQGIRAFDVDFMQRIYEKPLTVVLCSKKDMPKENEKSKPLGRNLDGCRIGFDAGGSDRKVSAVVDGKVIYSQEVAWFPKLHADPSYQYDGIMASMKTAASKMPKVDAIGVSAAGVYINSRVMAASLFIKVPKDVFDAKVKNMFFDIQKEFGNVPIQVANDGDVTALAGAMSLNRSSILGIAMGTSQAAGYVDDNGYITGWLNELAFVPIDYNPNAIIDEWSGDYGCGVKYFSQDGVIKVAPAAGIMLDESLSPAEKLKVVQGLMADGDKRAKDVYQTIGCYFGYALAYYAAFYDIKDVLVLGRVTSGIGGDIMVDAAINVLKTEFPKIADTLNLSMPDEKSKRVGQSVAAASLPAI